MSIQSKERDKCLKVKDANNEQDGDGLSKFTPKKILKLICGIYVIVAVVLTTVELITPIARKITRSPAEIRSHYAVALLILVAVYIVFHCFWRDEHKKLTREAASQFADIFINPTPKEHPYVLKWLWSWWQFFQFVHIICVFHWSLLTLVFGPDITNSYLDSRNVDLSPREVNETSMLEAQKIALDWDDLCIGYGKPILIWLFASAVFFSCEYLDGREAGKNGNSPEKKHQSNMARMIWRLYGYDGLEPATHTAIFIFWFRAVSSFPIISGWITTDFVESLNMFTSFFVVTLPAYVLYLMCCIALELLCEWAHRLRHGSETHEKRVPYV